MPITSIFYLLTLIFIAWLPYKLEKKSSSKIFEFLPPIVIVYFLAMLAGNADIFTSEIKPLQSTLRNFLLPLMIFLLLLKADMHLILQLKKRLLIAFFSATLSIMFSFIIVFYITQNWFIANASGTFAALSGSWMGGTVNMLSVASALEVNDTSLGYTLLIDSIDYAIWVMFLLSIVKASNVFNKFTKSDNSLEIINIKPIQNYNFSIPKILLVFLIGALLSYYSREFSTIFNTKLLGSSAWTILIITTITLIFAQTPLKKVEGVQQSGMALLSFLVALIGSQASIAHFNSLPLYILAGLMILIVHAILMVIAAKIFKLDLFSSAVASLSHIGGIASAPILAASYSQHLIPVGVVMATLGYIIGTFGGLIIGKILIMISS